MDHKMWDTSVATCLKDLCVESLRRNKTWRLCSCQRTLAREVWACQDICFVQRGMIFETSCCGMCLLIEFSRGHE